jgi:transposase
VTAGQVNECQVFADLMERLAIRSPHGPPKRRPRRVVGDKGYSTRPIRAWCRRRRVRAVIPERTDQQAQRRQRPGRPLAFDCVAYRRRNVIERVVGWLKHLRRLATRAEKLATHFAAMLTIALVARYATRYVSDTT